MAPVARLNLNDEPSHRKTLAKRVPTTFTSIRAITDQWSATGSINPIPGYKISATAAITHPGRPRAAPRMARSRTSSALGAVLGTDKQRAWRRNLREPGQAAARAGLGGAVSHAVTSAAGTGRARK
ncbi:MAG: hypothetical protein E6I78_06215 [Chloroflexi bacterium]|nr:MAG: hypothetical protein E6I78_06215 [Chloroflexota bacterium]